MTSSEWGDMNHMSPYSYVQKLTSDRIRCYAHDIRKMTTWKGSTMLAESQSELYFTRMANSLGDKASILEYLVPGRILDVGAGGGELAHVISEMGNKVYALDGSPQAINHIRNNFPDLEAVEAFTHDLVDKFTPGFFDTIVCSSILHEVFSYGNKGEPSEEALTQAIKDFFTILKPGGRLIIRDGVMPYNWGESTYIEFKDDTGEEFLDTYKSLSPFYSDTKGYRTVHIENGVKENSFECNMGSLMEFLYTYTWGVEAAERETQELYGVHTEEEYIDLLESYGFFVSLSYQYLQPGYPKHLKDKVSIYDYEGRNLPYPSSNMVIVAEKP